MDISDRASISNMNIVIDSVFALVGLGSGMIGLLLLYKSWSQTERSPALLGPGWALLLLSLFLWTYAGGADRGIALGLIVNSLLALCFVGYSASTQPPRKQKPAREKSPKQKSDQTGQAEWVKAFGYILFLGPVCGVIAFAIAMGIYQTLDMAGTEKANSLVSGLFAFPIIWAAIVSFCLISRGKHLKMAILVGAPLFSGALLLAGNK